LNDFLDEPDLDTRDEKLPENARFIFALGEGAAENHVSEELFAPSLNKAKPSDCLRAIQITVERHPDVLLFNGENCTKNHSEPPLLLWLMTKLLTAAAKENPPSFLIQLADAISGIYHALKSKAGHLDIASSFNSLIREVIESRVLYLQLIATN
jgi:hypothetical protein